MSEREGPIAADGGVHSCGECGAEVVDERRGALCSACEREVWGSSDFEGDSFDEGECIYSTAEPVCEACGEPLDDGEQNEGFRLCGGCWDAEFSSDAWCDSDGGW